MYIFVKHSNCLWLDKKWITSVILVASIFSNGQLKLFEWINIVFFEQIAAIVWSAEYFSKRITPAIQKVSYWSRTDNICKETVPCCLNGNSSIYIIFRTSSLNFVVHVDININYSCIWVLKVYMICSYLTCAVILITYLYLIFLDCSYI